MGRRRQHLFLFVIQKVVPRYLVMLTMWPTGPRMAAQSSIGHWTRDGLALRTDYSNTGGAGSAMSHIVAAAKQRVGTSVQFATQRAQGVLPLARTTLECHIGCGKPHCICTWSHPAEDAAERTPSQPPRISGALRADLDEDREGSGSHQGESF